MMDDKIKVLICDDSVNVCDSYELFIECEDDMSCVGVAIGSQQCLEQVKLKKPDLLLLDIQMESEDSGIKLLPKLKYLSHDMKIIMLTGYDSGRYVFKSLISGADGYVLKQTDIRKMFDEIRDIYNKSTKSDDNGEFDYIQAFKNEASNVYDDLLNVRCIVNDIVKLTVAEYEILKLIYDGNTYKKIAQMRVVEETTIKTTASKILKKLNCVSMKQLCDLLREIHFFEIEK